MKVTATLLPLATLGIGIAIGWFARPIPEPTSKGASEKPASSSVSTAGNATAAADARSAKTGDRKRSEVMTQEGLLFGSGDEDQLTADAKEIAGKMQAATVDRHRQKLQQYAASLEENLKLTPGQKAKLNAAIEAQVEEMEKLFERSGHAAGFNDDMKMVGTDPLEASIASLLSAEQKEELEGFKHREKTRKVDALALKNLSRLQGLFEFKEGQRDEVYRILSESAEASLAKPDPAASFSDIFTEGMGVEMDPYELGLQQLLTDSMMNPDLSGETDRKAAMKRFKEVVDKRIDERVEELGTVLDEVQLERYRAELKAKGLGPFSGMMMDLED